MILGELFFLRFCP